MKCAPIISVHYNRPRLSLAVLQSLARNRNAQNSELFIFSDGSRSEADEADVREVRKILKSHQWCGKVNIIERDQNLGCFENILSAIAEVCNLHDRFIYTEDDTVLSPYFLDYMNDALEKYEDQPSVMHISGYMWPVKKPLPETFFLKIPNIWTFATWKRAWKHYSDIDGASLLSEIKHHRLENDFTFNGTRNWLKILQKEVNGEKDCWDIYWAAMVYLNGLSLYPGRSLVRNIGLDGSGLHFNFATSAYNVNLATHQVEDFTDNMTEDVVTKQALAAYFQNIMPRRGSLVERGIYKVRKTIRKMWRSRRQSPVTD